jgi:hypothetical protein
MEKRYQVFLSSTYADLKEERHRVIQTLMEMDCIPSGMELFPAADEEQWQFIKKIIDDCDYYLLIIGGRYGSTTSEGVSYTEKEYDYAVERGMKVIAFIHDRPDEIPVGKSEIDPEIRKRLEAFRSKVAKNRIVKFWNSAEELPGLVALSLSKTIKAYPAVGWMRGDQVPNTELLTEINELRKKNAEWEGEILRLREPEKTQIPNLAPLDDEFVISGKCEIRSVSGLHDWRIETTWEEIFGVVSPYLLEHPHDDTVRGRLATNFFSKSKEKTNGYSPSINDQIYQTIKIQLLALNLVKIDWAPTVGKGMGLFWSLTKRGYELMVSLRTVKQKAIKNLNTSS